ncbi:MAG: hypothetical protein ACI7YS_17055 [Flavobacterium sp.]
MESLYIEESGENLRDLFNQKMVEVDAYITKGIQDFERMQIRYSPEVGATICGRNFAVEVNSWLYTKAGKEFCYLDTILDKKGEYFEIGTMPILIK